MREKKISIFLCLLLMTIMFAVAVPMNVAAEPTQVLIDFDDVSQGILNPNHYASLGVIFNGEDNNPALIWAFDVSVLDDPISGGVFSVRNSIYGYGGAWDNVIASFVNPITGEPAVTNYIHVGVSSGPGPDTLSSNVALIAYDSLGNIIATDYPDTTLQYDYLTISTPGIAKVKMEAGIKLDVFDDFIFNSPTSGIPVTIDIKPGSDPNSINLGAQGNVPVAIFSTTDFDATTIDPSTVTLAGAEVKLKGKSEAPQASLKDINGDGLIDLLVHILVDGLELEVGSTEAELIGHTYEGTEVQGSDSVNIVPA